MKKSNRIFGLFAALVIGLAGAAHAGVPLNSLDGHGGIAFNPLAYTGGLKSEDGPGWITKPQVGAWYVNLPKSHIKWNSYSVSLTLADRAEVSYAANLVNAKNYGDNSIFANSVGVKLRLLDENAGDTAWVPAIAIGAVYRHTDSKTVDLFGLDDDGFEYYVVATKLITQTPVPVLLSAGLQLSDEVVYGVVGHNHYGTALFANADVLPAENLAVGVEFRQGINAGEAKANGGRDLKNAEYWNGHVAWFVNDHLTLVGAYVYTGARDKGFDKLGFGDGFVLSAQYQF